MQKMTGVLNVLTAVFAMATGTVWADGTPSSTPKAPTPAPGGYSARYRLMFLTSSNTTATNTDISYYNQFVNNVANNLDGNTGSTVTNLGVTWRCVGSSSNVSARVNSKTLRPNDPGYDANWDLPIYNFAGELLAANNASMWDGSLLEAGYNVNGIWDGLSLENGIESPWGSWESDGYSVAWTGTRTDGNAYYAAGRGDGGYCWLGAAEVIAARSGRLWSGDWIAHGSGTWDPTKALRLYALSDPITAPVYTWYTLTFDGQGYPPSEASRQVTGVNELYGTRGPLPTVTVPEDMIFEGWYEDAAATGLRILDSTPLVISADKTIYAKVSTKWNGPAGPLVTNGLIGYWSFNDATADDRSGNNWHGTESTTYGALSYSSNDIPTGFGGASLDLTGGGSVGVITSGDEDVFDLQEHSIAFWTKGEPQGDWGYWIAKEGGFRINQRASGKTEMNYYIWGDGEARFGINHADNLWHHYVMTYDSSGDNSWTKNVYHNGVPIKTEAGKDPPNVLRTLAFGDRDGSDAAGYQPVGGTARIRTMMDEIYIFNRALTPEEVLTLYTPPTRAVPPTGTILIVR